MQIEIQKTIRELKIKNYSPKTIKSYVYALKQYFSFKKDYLTRYSSNNIREFLFFCEKKRISPQTRNIFLNAIKFYYTNIENYSKKIDIPFAKESLSLPIVLSRSEIIAILDSTKNHKHKLLLALSYGAGNIRCFLRSATKTIYL